MSTTTKRVEYVGPSAVVEVEPQDGSRPFVAVRGEPVEVSAAVAKSLLQQDTWKAAKAPSKTTKE